MECKLHYYGDAVLRQASQPVEQINDELRALAKAMLSRMYAEHGAGLAAQQVGHTEAICVIDVSPPDERDVSAAPVSDPPVPMPLVLVNPEIIHREGVQTGQEGCLSFPEIYVHVRRAESVTVRFMDLDGRTRELTGQGLLARAIEHELDHLNGVLLVDRMTPVQKVANSGRLKRLRRAASSR